MPETEYPSAARTPQDDNAQPGPNDRRSYSDARRAILFFLGGIGLCLFSSNVASAQGHFVPILLATATGLVIESTLTLIATLVLANGLRMGLSNSGSTILSVVAIAFLSGAVGTVIGMLIAALVFLGATTWIFQKISLKHAILLGVVFAAISIAVSFAMRSILLL